jgi:hypothetical protein
MRMIKPSIPVETTETASMKGSSMKTAPMKIAASPPRGR